MRPLPGALALHGSAALLALALVGCKPAVNVANPSPFDEDDPAATPDPDVAPDVNPGILVEPRARQADTPEKPRNPAAAAALDPTLTAHAPTPARSRPGLRSMTVARAQLHTTLDRGPAMFLRGIEIKPHFQDDRFRGWEIVQFMPGETRFDPFDLQPGDVIGRINGQWVARPQQLAALWTTLRSTKAIIIQVHRGTDAFELRFEVSDEANAAAP